MCKNGQLCNRSPYASIKNAVPRHCDTTDSSWAATNHLFTSTPKLRHRTLWGSRKACTRRHSRASNGSSGSKEQGGMLKASKISPLWRCIGTTVHWNDDARDDFLVKPTKQLSLCYFERLVKLNLVFNAYYHNIRCENTVVDLQECRAVVEQYFEKRRENSPATEIPEIVCLVPSFRGTKTVQWGF